MVSSLATQLTQNASLNSSFLVDRSRRKASESYLFTGREADQHDLESIYALGYNGFLQLLSVDEAFAEYEEALFSSTAKGTDRTLLSAEANSELHASISSFLFVLGPYLLEAPAGKILEWLVRRFRINEFDIESVLALFLPYHETLHFAKMNTILHIKPGSTWSFLLPYKSASQPIPRIALVTEMIQNTDVARFIATLLPRAIKHQNGKRTGVSVAHSTLVAFNAATLHDFICRSKTIEDGEEGISAFVLAALVEEPLMNRKNASRESILGSYALLAALSHKCSLTPVALKTIVVAMSNCARQVGATQFVNAVVSVCEPQDQMEDLPDSTVKTILRIANINNEIPEALVWEGIEKFLAAMLPGLIRRLDDQAVNVFVESLITAHNLPISFVTRLTAKLVSSALGSELPSSSSNADVGTATSRQFLSNIKQRYPAQFQAVVEGIIGNPEEEEQQKAAVERLCIELSTLSTLDPGTSHGGNTSTTTIDLIVASANAEPRVRADAVRKLVDALSQGSSSLSESESLSPADVDSIHSALLSRLHDTNQLVLEALYSKPETLSTTTSSKSTQYLDGLEAVLNSTSVKLKHAVIKYHFTFLLSSHFFFNVKADGSMLEDAFERIVFPFLLSSKPRQRTAGMVWNLIEQGSNDMSSSAHELLKGCAETRKKVLGEEDTPEKMAKMNLAISAKMAENVLASNNYRVHLDIVLLKAKDSKNAHACLFGLLILRALLERLSGEHQVEVGHRILNDVLNHEVLIEFGMSAFSGEEVAERLDEVTLAQNAVVKPNSKNTSLWLQLSLITVMARFTIPDGLRIDWIANQSMSELDDRAYQYAKLKRQLYKLAHLLGPALGVYLIRDLFISLKHEAMVFLAGVWLGAEDGEGDVPVQASALQHGLAFIQAHNSADVGVDFQTIVPSLLVALQSPEESVRRIATECFAVLNEMKHKFTRVYAFDAVYGASQDQIQYLSQEDLKSYVEAIVKHREHFLFDAGYAKVFHQEHLGKVANDSKKDTSHKHRVLCYLLSHINAMTLPSAQRKLLGVVSGISDKSKTQILLPTIQSLAEKPLNMLSRLFGSYLGDIAKLCIASFDLSVLAELNSEKHLWDVFVSLLRRSLSLGVSGPLSTLTPVMVQQLTSGLFAGLSRDQKIEVCKVILEQGVQEDAEIHLHCKNLLRDLLDDASVIIQLLSHLQSAMLDGPRASKRVKVADGPEDAMSHLSLLAEVLGSRPLPGSFDLISHLLETLNKVMQSVASPQADITFIEQSLMSAIENAAEKVIEAPNLVPNTIRLDVLVELIRDTDNPQTFHQALLLIASLTRLAPESVLHNIMPVFTFMGSNIFHRDDTYSFAVVQKTIDNIVPVMITSFKQGNKTGLDLYITARDFLRVFTDAANHIPRHRRANFFTHLVNVLGPSDFLAPICLLLIEKSTNRIVRQNAEDVQNALTLPVSLLHHYSSDIQTFVLAEVLRESERLTQRVTKPDVSPPTFLDESLFEEHSASPSALYKRRSQATIIFVGQAAKAFAHEDINGTHAGGKLSDLVSQLLKLSRNTDSKIEDIVNVARSCLIKVMNVVSVLDFIDAILLMLSSEDTTIQEGALELLSDRLPHVSSDTRKTITPSINKILGFIHKLLSQQSEESFITSSFMAITSIGRTLCNGEESIMTSLVPFAISTMRSRRMAAQAISALAVLPTKLGPRLIPYFRDIISEAVALLRDAHDDLIGDGVSVLEGLLITIPTFWSKSELSQLVKLLIDLSITQKTSQHIIQFTGTVTKRAPAKALLPTLCEMWQQIESLTQIESTICYLGLLKRSLRTADRPVVQENLRPLFNVFLTAFDKARDAEAQAISAFVELVVKLNEVTFRPLFRRLHDWAFVDENGQERKVIFCHVYTALLEFFKGLMNPYMTLVLGTFVDILKGCAVSGSDDNPLLVAVLGTLTRSLISDDGSFWRDDKLRQVASTLVSQIPVCARFSSLENKQLLQSCLVAMVEHLTDDTLLKSVNLDILMHTRSEESRVKLFALECSETLWKAHGGKLLGFVAETATFIAECCEDENDIVARESFKVKDAVESVAGSINVL
ncbi:hypothetical protein K435DRAFT_779869 [Dendrothele bispora CBS 962.96]|uniref:U3 small nucleolar RNA-associated protein 10 n=1 Tax=Dendrothele bispora (strain CBS 962.96) TaxID=1314807 RepID=A0A4S8LUV2_DENBC|nr:hypothetical protein K435DRAFT_779869 [Dendrothele bispora CBS 962.96]